MVFQREQATNNKLEKLEKDSKLEHKGKST